MSAKNQKNLIVVGGVVIALLAGTVLLGGFVKSEPTAPEQNAAIGSSPTTGYEGSPTAKTSGSEEACPSDCTKPCCAEKASEGCCGEPKPCCPNGPPAGCCGEPKPSSCRGDEAEPEVK